MTTENAARLSQLPQGGADRIAATRLIEELLQSLT
jgi:hypothetical protein